MQFVLQENKLLYVSIFLSLLSVSIEILAIMSLVELLSALASETQKNSAIFIHILDSVDLKPEAPDFLLIFATLLMLRIFTLMVSQLLNNYLGRQIMAQLTVKAFRKILFEVPVREIYRKSIGYYINIAGDESNRTSTLVMSMTQLLSTMTLACLYFIALITYSTKAGIALLVVGLISLMCLRPISQVFKELGSKQIDLSRNHSALFVDSMNSIKIIRSHNSEEYIAKLHNRVIFEYARHLYQSDGLAVVVRLFPIGLILGIFILWLLIKRVDIAIESITFIVAVIVYLMRLLPLIGQCIVLGLRVASDGKSAGELVAFLKMEYVNQFSKSSSLGKINNIEFKDVGFAYNSEKNLFYNVNFQFQSGKSYALIGKSGSGKSTLLDLLVKFLEVSQGSIRVNNLSLNQLSNEQLREKILLVSQEGAIYEDTIYNNLTLGLKVNNDSVIKACKLACIDDYIINLPDGYKTKIHYQGKNLSGGQKQRIALARALIREPDVLILDESTSALDKSTQDRIIKNVLQAYSSRIVLLITHDSQITCQVSEVLNLELFGSSPA